MTQASHYSSGALLGKFIPNPLLAFIAGVVLHLVIDKVPHFWPTTKREKDIFTYIDIAVAIPMIIIVFLFNKAGVSAGMFWGFAGSALVDIILVKTPIYKTSLGQWHTNRQPHRSNLSYLATDIVMTVACLIILFI